MRECYFCPCGMCAGASTAVVAEAEVDWDMLLCPAVRWTAGKGCTILVQGPGPGAGIAGIAVAAAAVAVAVAVVAGIGKKAPGQREMYRKERSQRANLKTLPAWCLHAGVVEGR